MQPFLPKKESAPDFSNPSVEQAYVQEAHDVKSLLQKELDVNQMEQNLLQQRIAMMRSFINDLPASDPQYSMLLTQIQMDNIEMDELKTRETILIQNIEEEI
ncbi:MAG TPA: hypothetical protein VLE89_00475 [Chlamydiales bacterium]|nr:hypothetical protein [Chlamydiales bacterium]